MTVGQALLYALALYVAAGLAVGIAFVMRGADRVLSTAATFTPGARMLLLPGAAALWPYVLARWRRTLRQ